jgi:outer membrane immunogenic protein
MKRALIAGAAVLALAGPLWAADLPQPAPPPLAPVAYIPVVAPVYNWGGIYYGINGGYGFGKSDWTTPFASTGNFNTSGFAVGATVGANYQVDAFVFGVEGDIDWMGIQGTSGICTPACETKSTWLSTFRGRAGYASDRVLFYATGGGAFGNIQAGASGSTLTNTNKAGWTAGGGVEAAFADHWTARVEYLFVDFQNATPFASTTVKLDENLIRFGIDYKFR